MREYVSKIKDLHKIDIDIDGDISEAIVDPKAFAEKIANKILLQNIDRIKKSTKTREEFGEGLYSVKFTSNFRFSKLFSQIDDILGKSNESVIDGLAQMTKRNITEGKLEVYLRTH